MVDLYSTGYIFPLRAVKYQMPKTLGPHGDSTEVSFPRRGSIGKVHLFNKISRKTTVVKDLRTRLTNIAWRLWFGSSTSQGQHHTSIRISYTRLEKTYKNTAWRDSWTRPFTGRFFFKRTSDWTNSRKSIGLSTSHFCQFPRCYDRGGNTRQNAIKANQTTLEQRSNLRCCCVSKGENRGAHDWNYHKTCNQEDRLCQKEHSWVLSRGKFQDWSKQILTRWLNSHQTYLLEDDVITSYKDCIKLSKQFDLRIACSGQQFHAQAGRPGKISTWRSQADLKR